MGDKRGIVESLLLNVTNMVNSENLEKYVLGTMDDGRPRSIMDVIYENKSGKKKKKKQKEKDSDYSLYSSLGIGNDKKKKKKKKKKKHKKIKF